MSTKRFDSYRKEKLHNYCLKKLLQENTLRHLRQLHQVLLLFFSPRVEPKALQQQQLATAIERGARMRCCRPSTRTAIGPIVPIISSLMYPLPKTPSFQKN